MKIKICVGIPTINQSKMLNESLAKYFHDFYNRDIIIVDNGSQDILTRKDKFHIYRPKKGNIGVSASWNYILKRAMKTDCSHVLMLNDDIYLGKTTKEVEAMIGDLRYADLFKSEHHFCSFIVPIFTFNRFGGFDEGFFPAYFEDNDYLYRIKLEEGYVLTRSELNPLIYNNSLSIKKDPSLNSKFMDNQNRYVEKWGGLPREETYTKPFNKDE